MLRATFFLLLFCFLTSLSHASSTAPDSLVGPTQHHISLANAPATRSPAFFGFDSRLRPSYSPRKERITRRMLISGAVCLAIGIPTIIYAAVQDGKDQRSNTVNHAPPLSVVIGVLGGISTGAGIGLIIPGSIIRYRNHKRLREVQ